jgi:hypothetical protein
VRAPQSRPPSKLEPYEAYLVDRLSEFPELSAVSLFEEVKALGYEGQISILKDFTRPYRIRRREPVVRFETPPGRHAAGTRFSAGGYPSISADGRYDGTTDIAELCVNSGNGALKRAAAEWAQENGFYFGPAVGPGGGSATWGGS